MTDSETCPKCNSKDTCHISYGYPRDIEEYLKLISERKIHPGGCVIYSDSPARYCNNCENKWGEFDSDKTDSIDYDQGFDIEEVCDQ